MGRTQQIAELLDAPESENLDDRVTAIQVPGEVGDVEALQHLREHMKMVSREHCALHVAIGRLKRKLHVK